MQTVKDPGCGYEEAMMRMVNEWQLPLLRLCYAHAKAMIGGYSRIH